MNKLVKCNYYYVYQHPDNRLETVEPGSVVSLDEDIARQFVARGLGRYTEGPERLIRPGEDADAPRIERPGSDPRHGRAESALAAPQRAR